MTRRLAPIIALTYAFGYTFLAFDQVMSLEPTWFSNLFGAYFAWGAFLTAVTELLDDEKERARMAREARRRAERFSLDRMVREVEDLYEGIGNVSL